MKQLRNRFFASLLSLLLLAPAAMPQFALAADPFGQANLNSAATKAYGSTPQSDLQSIVGRIIKGFLGLLGILFIILTLWAGFTWMTAAGNEEKVTSAKKMIVQATIGLAVVLAAYAITAFVIDKLQTAVQ